MKLPGLGYTRQQGSGLLEGDAYSSLGQPVQYKEIDMFWQKRKSLPTLEDRLVEAHNSQALALGHGSHIVDGWAQGIIRKNIRAKIKAWLLVAGDIEKVSIAGVADTEGKVISFTSKGKTCSLWISQVGTLRAITRY